jgi:hypothetical protein
MKPAVISRDISSASLQPLSSQKPRQNKAEALKTIIDYCP